MNREETEQKLLRRYEDMLRNGGRCYFDTEEIEDIARRYEMMRLFDEALGVVEYGLQLHPGNPELLVLRADYLLCLDRIEEAARQIDAVPVMSVDALLVRMELALINQDNSAALKLKNELLSSAEFSWELSLDIIEIFIDYRESDEIAPIIDESLARLSAIDGDTMLHELAFTYEDRMRFDDAIGIYNRLLDRNPYAADDWFAMARLLAERERYDEAIEACDFALAIEDNKTEVMLFRGCCFYDKGDSRQAMRIFKETLDNAPDKGHARILLAPCYSHMGQYDRSLEMLTSAVNDYNIPPNEDIYYRIATCHYNLGDKPAARQALEKALAIDDTHIDTLSLMGDVMLDMGPVEKAIPYYKRILEIDPANNYAYKCLAYINNELALTDTEKSTEYSEKTIEYYQKAVKVSGESDLEAVLELALAYFRNNRPDEALQWSDTIHDLFDSGLWREMDDITRERVEALYGLYNLLRRDSERNSNFDVDF